MRASALTVTLAATIVAVPLLAQRPTCGPTRRPKQLPAVSTLVDSSAAIMELGAAHVVRDSMRFTLIFPDDDSIPLIHALDSTDNRAAAVIARSVWRQKPDKLWAIRVRVAGGTTPALTLERATYCPPELTSASKQPVDIRTELVAVPAGSGAPGVSRSTRSTATATVFEIMVTETGTVRDVRLITSSGTPALDQEMASHNRQLRFAPALIDGLAIPALYRTDNNTPRP
jgi:TonB family protein